MEAEALQSEEILFDLAANEFCVLEQFYGTDFEGINLCEVTDGQGRYWLTRDYMLARLVVRPCVAVSDEPLPRRKSSELCYS